MYGDTILAIPPNLTLPIILLNMSFGGKLPNLMTANTSGYTVFGEIFTQYKPLAKTLSHEILLLYCNRSSYCVSLNGYFLPSSLASNKAAAAVYLLKFFILTDS